MPHKARGYTRLRMRGPIVVGVLAGFLVAVVVAAAFLALVMADPAGGATATSAAGSPVGPSGTPPSPTISPGPDSTAAPSREPAASPTFPSPGPSPSNGIEFGLAVGDVAPPLRLTQLAGAEVDTVGLRGQPLWVNFMATWCPPCRDELPIMDRLQRELGDRMTIIVVDVEEDGDTVAAFFASLEVALPVALDEDGRARDEWGAVVLPVHYWIDEEGRVGAFLYGGAGVEQFIEGIGSVLPDAGLEP